MITKSVAEINEYVGSSVNPMATPDQIYELYSVPSFESGSPEIVLGADIGSTKVIVEDGDILICKINPRINRVWVVHHNTEYPLLASSEWIVVRNAKMNSDYLKWYFSSPRFRTLLSSQVTGIGGSLTRAQPKQVAKYPVPIPSRDEQDCIADILARVDYLMHKYQQQIISIEQLVKSRFIELFGDQTANPYAWQQTSIGACCTLKSGTSLPADKENEGGAIPYVKVGDMNYSGNEQYITTSSRFVSEQTAGTGVFPVGTVVFPKRGGAIGTNKKRLTRLPICADLNVMGVTAGRRLTPQYLMAYFNTVDLGTLNNGSSVPQINNKDIAPLLICIPPMALQEQFATFVEQTDKSKYYKSIQILKLITEAIAKEVSHDRIR